MTDEIVDFDSFEEYKSYWNEIDKYIREHPEIAECKGKGNPDTEQYVRYRKVLRELAPENLANFLDIKYNNPKQWKQLKYQYRTINRYEVDEGYASAATILELDNAAFYTKKLGFNPEPFHGDERKKVRKLTTEGNAASMRFNGRIYFSHSRFGEIDSLANRAYDGNYPIVGLKENRKFKVMDFGDGSDRKYCTEAKFFEFIATTNNPDDKFSVTILSEKHICESCQGVLKQFKQEYPNAVVNIISGKRGYNGDPNGGKTWKHRKKVKRK